MSTPLDNINSLMDDFLLDSVGNPIEEIRGILNKIQEKSLDKLLTSRAKIYTATVMSGRVSNESNGQTIFPNDARKHDVPNQPGKFTVAIKVRRDKIEEEYCTNPYSNEQSGKWSEAECEMMDDVATEWAESETVYSGVASVPKFGEKIIVSVKAKSGKLMWKSSTGIDMNTLTALLAEAGGNIASLFAGHTGVVGSPEQYGKIKCPSSSEETGRLQQLANKIGIELPVLLAIRKVESGGATNAVRFEPHHFVGRYRTDLKSSWLASGWYKPGGNAASPSVDYVKANTNKAALMRALEIDAVAAVKSTSWGSFQVMGTTARKSDIEVIKNAVKDAAGAKKFVEYFFANPETVSDEMLASWFSSRSDVVNHAKNKDWKAFATRYNGRGCCGAGSHNYDLKLADAYAQALGCILYGVSDG
jgi:hypothetical protein